MRPTLYTSIALASSVAASCVLATAASAQVAGVGYTLAPRAAYLFPSDNSGLENQFAIGADFGFSFGQFIELRANYLQGIGGATELERLGEDLLDNGSLPDSRDVNVRRIGGDVKFNLGKGAFLPYVLVGTGIQRTRITDDLNDVDLDIDNENIYGNAGIGFVLSAADRYTFFVEGRYLQYRFNAFNALLTDAERVDLRTPDGGLVEVNTGNRRTGNYSVETGVAFYLGGRRPGEMTELDEAYARQFGDGFRGVSLEIEPTLSRINFADASPFRDTWLGGAALGFNFGPLVGIRGYYLRAMQDDEINFDFDDLAVYGLDMRFNLNTVRTGIAPFLTLGGGLIDPDGAYSGRLDGDGNARLDLDGQGFASGGGGIVLGLTRNLKLRGAVKALLTSDQDLLDENVTTDQINTSTQYTIGLDLALGRKADGDQLAEDMRAEAVEEQRQRDLVQRDSLLSRQDSIFEARLAKQDSVAEARLARSQNVRDSIRLSYEAELAQREEELNEAIAARDRVQIDSMQALVAETESLLDDIEDAEAESRRRDLERQRAREDAFMAPGAQTPYVQERYVRDADGNLRVQREYTEPQSAARGGTIRMSVAEFEGLIEEIFESSLPLGPEVFAPTQSSRAAQQPLFDPMTGERLQPRNDNSEEVRRENEQLRRELQQLRRDVDAMRGGARPRSSSSAPAPTNRTAVPDAQTPPAESAQVRTPPSGEDRGATVLDEVGLRPEEPAEKKPENRDGDGVTVLDEVGIREEEAADKNEMPTEAAVVEMKTSTEPLKEETKKERKAREKAERKAAKAAEKANDPND